MSLFPTRAIDGTRTRGLDLGKVALHQLSHYRIIYAPVFTGTYYIYHRTRPLSTKNWRYQKASLPADKTASQPESLCTSDHNSADDANSCRRSLSQRITLSLDAISAAERVKY